MTDQEKAEEYVKEHILRPKSAATYIDELSQAYLAGIAEGRKEEDEKLFNEWCKGETPEPHECPFLQKLEKENTELKAHIDWVYVHVRFAQELFRSKKFSLEQAMALLQDIMNSITELKGRITNG